jgi:ABC-type glycerol-3-phosphate transport system permease component
MRKTTRRVFAPVVALSLFAAAFVQAFIPLVVFFALQRYFVRGLLAGSVKG